MFVTHSMNCKNYVEDSKNQNRKSQEVTRINHHKATFTVVCCTLQIFIKIIHLLPLRSGLGPSRHHRGYFWLFKTSSSVFSVIDELIMTSKTAASPLKAFLAHHNTITTTTKELHQGSSDAIITPLICMQSSAGTRLVNSLAAGGLTGSGVDEDVLKPSTLSSRSPSSSKAGLQNTFWGKAEHKKRKFNYLFKKKSNLST